MPRTWEGLKPGLSPWILEAVYTMGYDSMTPVQAATIPLFMGNKDVVVEAVTGSGKTLAFLIPVIERLYRLEEPTMKHHIAAIVLSPTRELATQIYSVLESLLAFHPARHDKNDEDREEPEKRSGEAQTLLTPQLLLGGKTTNAQDIKEFLKASPNLIVATPGKLAALLSSSRVFCSQSSFEVLVLDEADRLLDLGFKTDLQKIMAQLPKQRRTGLFSASVSEAVGELVRAGLRNPVKVSVKVKSTTTNAEQRTPASLSLNYSIAPPRKRLLTISKILSSLQPTPQKSILYVSTCAAVDYFRHILPLLLPSIDGQPIELIPLHGKYRAKTRQKNFSRFLRSTTPTLLLTTDVAARGLDIPEVDLVLQLDPPKDPAIFLHRCGRAGRAGRKGSSIVLIQPGREEEYVDYLGIRGTPVTRLDLVDIEASDDEVDRAERKIRQEVLSDRAIHDKAQRAFVSWVRSYREHQAGSIFRISDLDWESLGKAWGLLRLPKMPELKQWDGDKFLGVEIDMKTFSYKDKIQEKQRIAKLAEMSLADQSPSNTEARPKARQSWSQKSEEREQNEARREKVKRKREAIRIDRMTTEEKQQELETLRLVEEVKRRKLLEETPWSGFED